MPAAVACSLRPLAAPREGPDLVGAVDLVDEHDAIAVADREVDALAGRGDELGHDQSGLVAQVDRVEDARPELEERQAQPVSAGRGVVVEPADRLEGPSRRQPVLRSTSRADARSAALIQPRSATISSAAAIRATPLLATPLLATSLRGVPGRPFGALRGSCTILGSVAWIATPLQWMQRADTGEAEDPSP